jgi:hypothetical protein
VLSRSPSESRCAARAWRLSGAARQAEFVLREHDGLLRRCPSWSLEGVLGMHAAHPSNSELLEFREVFGSINLQRQPR